jgi:c-di-GMP-binding flagellar brake protein YcgR
MKFPPRRFGLLIDVCNAQALASLRELMLGLQPAGNQRSRPRPRKSGAAAANCSLTLSALGFPDTEEPAVEWRNMALPNKRSILPAAEERRRFQRVKVHLLGRYMLPDRREFPCQIINMSPGGLALLAPGIGNVGDRVIAYLDHIGRVEGKITRIIDNGFAMTVGATARKRDKLAAQLTWLANRDILNLPEDRRHDRIVPRNPIAVLTLDDGTKMTCRIIDLSLSGAAIAAENRPPLKSHVMLGRVQARVVRNLEDGFAIEFVHEQLAETLEDNVTAR